MKPLSAEDIRGNWATLLLPWNQDDSLDLERLTIEIDCLIAAKVDGIYAHGSAGEFHTLTEKEFDQVSVLLAEKSEAHFVPYQIGVSHMSANISLERLQRIKSLKPGAVQVILPDWFVPTENEVLTFLHRMSEAAGEIGLVLYNPPHAKKVLTPEALGYIANQVPQLIGLKTAGGDEAWYQSMRDNLTGISVFVPGHTLASGIEAGAQGSYSNVACLNPTRAQQWREQIETDLPGALELEKRIRTFIKIHISPFITDLGYCAAACDRLMANIGGWADIGAHMSWPYQSIPLNEAERLKGIATQLIPEFFEGKDDPFLQT